MFAPCIRANFHVDLGTWDLHVAEVKSHGPRALETPYCRATGLQDLAPCLLRMAYGMRSVADILLNAPVLLVTGVPSWNLGAMVRGRLETSAQSAEGIVALADSREAALRELRAAVLSATTQPSVRRRLHVERTDGGATAS